MSLSSVAFYHMLIWCCENFQEIETQKIIQGQRFCLSLGLSLYPSVVYVWILNIFAALIVGHLSKSCLLWFL